MARGAFYGQCFPMVSSSCPQLLLSRHEVKEEDTWDLSALFIGPSAWEQGLAELRGMKGRMLPWIGKLHDAKELSKALVQEREIDLLTERLGQYASLRVSEDEGDGAARDRSLRLDHLLTELSEETSWFLPELMKIDDQAWEKMITVPCLQEWAGKLERIRRARPHILQDGEERLMALAAPALGGQTRFFPS